MAVYRLTSAITLDTAYSGNALSDSVVTSRVLRPRQYEGAWYLGVYDTGLAQWTDTFFTGGDTLQLQTFTLTLGMSILTYDGLAATITNGMNGRINLLPGSITINANLTALAPTVLLNVGTNSNGYEITIKGNLSAGPTGSHGCHANNTSAALIVYGNLYGGTQPNPSGCNCSFLSGGSITVYGNVIGGSAAGGVGIPGSTGLTISGGAAAINGNVTGGNTLSYGCSVAGSVTGLTINGDVVAGYGINTGGLYVGAPTPVVVNGNIRCNSDALKNIGVSGRVDTLSWTGYFQMYSGGVSYNLYKNGNGGAAGRSGLYRSLR